jgi:SAM-dependent methyltransferase
MRSSTPGHWDRYWRERREISEVYDNQDRLLREVRDLSLAGRRVLEVGAGSGRDSLEIARWGASVVLLDYVMSAFDVIRPRASSAGVQVREGTFALVFHQGLLEHFRDPRPLLDRNRYLTAPGGYCLIDVPQRYHPYTLAKHIMIALNRWFAGWETEFSPGDLRRRMTEAGFDVVHTGGDWMVPGFFYRSLRYGLWRAGVARLPMYPREIWGIGPLMRRLRDFVRRTPLGPCTFAMVNVLARRPLE